MVFSCKRLGGWVALRPRFSRLCHICRGRLATPCRCSWLFLTLYVACFGPCSLVLAPNTYAWLIPNACVHAYRMLPQNPQSLPSRRRSQRRRMSLQLSRSRSQRRRRKMPPRRRRPVRRHWALLRTRRRILTRPLHTTARRRS